MKQLLFFTALLFFAACRDNPDDALQPAPGNHIRLNDMAAGQISRYVLFRGESYYDPDNFSFEYLPDTLVLTVVGQDADGWLIEEKLAPGSASLNGDGPVQNPEAVYQYYWKIQNDTLFLNPVPGPGQQWWVDTRFTANEFALPLAPFTDPVTDIKGWKTTHPYTESYWTATDPAYALFGIYYAGLNILTENTHMQVDGPGSWYAYTAANGIVKTASYSWWTQEGLGWDLLPD